MAPENEESYMLYVVSAEITEGLLTSSPSLQVMVRVDESAAQYTSEIERDRSPSWNEEFLIYGRKTSIISLPIKNKMSSAAGHCVDHVNVTLGTVLDACSGDEFTILKAKSEGIEVEKVTAGTIVVKLRSLRGHDNAKMIGLEIQMSSPLDSLDRSGCHTHPDNGRGEVMPKDGRNLSQQRDLDGLGIGGIQFMVRFWQLGKLADLEHAIASLQRALELVDDQHSINQCISATSVSVKQLVSDTSASWLISRMPFSINERQLS